MGKLVLVVVANPRRPTFDYTHEPLCPDPEIVGYVTHIFGDRPTKAWILLVAGSVCEKREVGGRYVGDE
jgi:hypothetical protein